MLCVTACGRPGGTKALDRGASSTSELGASVEGTADTTPVKVVERAEDAYWNGDLDGLMRFYAPNAEGFVLAAGDSAGKCPRDLTKTRAMYEKTFKDTSRQSGEVAQTMVHGPVVIRQYGSGEAARIRYLWMFEVRGGKIRRYWTSPVAVP
jgi:ketosteroid isomerase-like protein